MGLVAPALGEQIAGDAALDVVPAHHAEHVGEALLGERRVGGEGRDHQDACIRIDLRGGDRGAGAEVAEHRGDAVGDQLLRGGDGLLAVAIVVGR